jgi:hypothetical protein
MPSGAVMTLGKFALLVLCVLCIETGLEQRYGLHFDMHTWDYWIGSALIWFGICAIQGGVIRK